MVQLFYGLLGLHIATGLLGLIALWPPLIARKGGAIHRQWGRYFCNAIIATGVLAVAMSLLTLLDPLGTHPKLTDVELIRSYFGTMMLYLATFTVTLGWFGLECVRHRRDHRRHRNPLTLGLIAATAFTALLCAGHGFAIGQPLMIGVAVLGVVTAALNAQFIFTTAPGPSDWLIQHLRALVGGGVSGYTAFFSFGAANLLPAVAFNPVLWAAPTVIGVTLIGYHEMMIKKPWRSGRPSHTA